MRDSQVRHVQERDPRQETQDRDPNAAGRNDGTSKPNMEAAIMTPPANPSIASSNRSGAFLTKRAGNAPKPVAKPAARLARKPAVMRSRTLFSTKAWHP